MAIDPTVTLLAGLFTQLGAAWFVVGLGAVIAWSAPRSIQAPHRVGLCLVAFALTAFGAVGVLKPLFAVPRPPGAASAHLPPVVPAVVAPGIEWAVTGRGFSFPSGHAAVATAGYGGLALLLDRGSVRNRLAAATVIVATVAGTRVLLGVHRPSEVTAGVGVGLMVLGLLVLVARVDGRATPGVWNPGRALGVAAGSLLLALAVALGTGYAHGVRPSLLALGVTGVALAVAVRSSDAGRRSAG